MISNPKNLTLEQPGCHLTSSYPNTKQREHNRRLKKILKCWGEKTKLLFDCIRSYICQKISSSFYFKIVFLVFLCSAQTSWLDSLWNVNVSLVLLFSHWLLFSFYPLFFSLYSSTRNKWSNSSRSSHQGSLCSCFCSEAFWFLGIIAPQTLLYLHSGSNQQNLNSISDEEKRICVFHMCIYMCIDTEDVWHIMYNISFSTSEKKNHLMHGCCFQSCDWHISSSDRLNKVLSP